MRRYWIDDQKWESDTLTIFGDSYHHIFTVCRTESGEKFEVIGVDQKAHFVEVVEVKKKDAKAKRISSRSIPALPLPELHLVLAIPRPAIIPTILEKAVEMGVHSVHLIFTERSYFRHGQGKDLNWGKYRKGIVKALQQSGRGQPMELRTPIKFKEKITEINRQPKVECLFPFEGVAQEDLKNRMNELRKFSPEKIYFFIGSEGGFSADEVKLMQDAGIKPVSLGPQVLRVETACVAVATVLKYEFDLMKDWGAADGSI